MLNTSLMYRRIRNICGLLGMILPWVAILTTLLVKNRDSTSLYSISATYYNSPALVAILTSASIVLMTYDGYSKLDNLITTFSGVFGLGIVLFPCSVGWLNSNTLVGTFQLPMYISNYIHCTCAAIFFILLAFNSAFLFTKTDDLLMRSNNKKKRNIVYRICAIGMLIPMIWQVIYNQFNLPGWWTMVNEIIMLQFFGISWLTKGNILFFKDKY